MNEITEVFAHLDPGTKVRARLQLLQWTGMRPSQEGRLTPKDFHLDEEIPYVIVGHGKGGDAVKVPLLEEGLAAARDFIALNAFGKWRTEPGNRAIVKAAAAAGLPTFTTYQIRHSFAAGLRQAGADIADIQDLYGHMNAEMTKRYAPGVIEKHQEAIGRLFGVNYFCRSTTIILAGALAVTPEAPGQLDSLQYRQIQIADLLEQLRGRGPGEGLRQRVPPLPVLFLQFQERLHGVVPLLWPRSPVRWPAVPDPGLAGLAPLPVTCLPLRVRQRHTTILHRYVTDRGSGRPSDRDASVATDPPLGCRRHRCTRARWSATAERLPGAALPGSRTWASLPAGPQGLPARSATGSHPKGRSVAEEPRSGLTACG